MPPAAIISRKRCEPTTANTGSSGRSQVGGGAGAGASPAARSARIAALPSASRTTIPSTAITAPDIIIRWVAPQSVTSWPKSRCEMSSSGKPSSAKPAAPEREHPADRRVPVGR